MDSKHRLFVYGSLRSGFQNEAYKYLTAHFTFLGEGKVRGKLYYNGSVPVAKPTDEPVYLTGELYQLNHPEDYSWVFSQLDDYEGLNTMPGEQPAYRREPVRVNLQDRTLITWIYWYNDSVEGMEPIASGDLFEYIKSLPKP
ncbi:MAG TPA: gamma-glutamylcyclotransferase [Ferruginibacter sp.]|mgnify:CR=1 FL=1|nr:gamma-glutamylcyclotransferase [Ferruginibacter sp.]HRO16938.1 gamma-glutamylcyclotransferase [Ferruginibacter sp.]HRQ20599.1 gamma-glutamylcyclotransferase [Ferruginibacter sp.]